MGRVLIADDESDNNLSHHLLSQKDFTFICQFVYQNTGIVLHEGKRAMVYRRLSRIVRERKFDSFTQYCQLLKNASEKEQAYFINAITTNLTGFFREKHHFDYLLNHEIPHILAQNKKYYRSKKFRIWSSATSTGEEAYSIAITLLKAMKAAISTWDVKILATDIDSNVIEIAKQGKYSQECIEKIPVTDQKTYFHRQQNNKGKFTFQASEKLKELITFKQLNLLHQWPIKGPFDIIFCRNVIIYFDKATQQHLFERYYELLKPGGLLILGHSESLGAYQTYFESVGRTIFRKPY